MERTLLDRKELAERWGYTDKTLITMENNGLLKRVPNITGVKYSIREVERVENAGLNISPLSQSERLRLEREIAKKDKELNKLRAMITSIKVVIEV